MCSTSTDRPQIYVTPLLPALWHALMVGVLLPCGAAHNKVQLVKWAVEVVPMSHVVTEVMIAIWQAVWRDFLGWWWLWGGQWLEQVYSMFLCHLNHLISARQHGGTDDWDDWAAKWAQRRRRWVSVCVREKHTPWWITLCINVCASLCVRLHVNMFGEWRGWWWL